MTSWDQLRLRIVPLQAPLWLGGTWGPTGRELRTSSSVLFSGETSAGQTLCRKGSSVHRLSNFTLCWQLYSVFWLILIFSLSQAGLKLVTQVLQEKLLCRDVLQWKTCRADLRTQNRLLCAHLTVVGSPDSGVLTWQWYASHLGLIGSNVSSRNVWRPYGTKRTWFELALRYLRQRRWDSRVLLLSLN